MKKTIAYLLSLVILSTSTIAIAARPTPLTVEEIEMQRPLALRAYKEGILDTDLSLNYLREPPTNRKHIVREVKRITGWQIPEQSPTEPVVDLLLLDFMKDHFDFFGSVYIMLITTLTDDQREDAKNYPHYYIQRPELYIPQKPRWQKDWSNLQTGLSYQDKLLPRLLAIKYFTNPYHVLERAKYNYVNHREEGMTPAQMVQFAEEMPWFGQCVQDTYTSTILNKKYEGKSLDINKMLRLIKARKTLFQNTQEKLDKMKSEIGDQYVQQYIQMIQNDQYDENISWLMLLQAKMDVPTLPGQINKVARYCVAVHASAQLLQTYNDRYGQKTEE